MFRFSICISARDCNKAHPSTRDKQSMAKSNHLSCLDPFVSWVTTCMFSPECDATSHPIRTHLFHVHAIRSSLATSKRSWQRAITTPAPKITIKFSWGTNVIFCVLSLLYCLLQKQTKLCSVPDSAPLPQPLSCGNVFVCWRRRENCCSMCTWAKKDLHFFIIIIINLNQSELITECIQPLGSFVLLISHPAWKFWQ